VWAHLDPRVLLVHLDASWRTVTQETWDLAERLVFPVSRVTTAAVELADLKVLKVPRVVSVLTVAMVAMVKMAATVL
jgi:hypothetical protein